MKVVRNLCVIRVTEKINLQGHFYHKSHPIPLHILRNSSLNTRTKQLLEIVCATVPLIVLIELEITIQKHHFVTFHHTLAQVDFYENA